MIARDGFRWLRRLRAALRRGRLIDGVAVACDGDRLGVRLAALPAAERTGVSVRLDLLELNGRDMRREPLQVRKATLA
jgi:ATP-dependent DNA ligase